jgi:hypothetical protein
MYQAPVVVVTEGCTDHNDGTVFCRLNGVSCIRILSWHGRMLFMCVRVYVLSFTGLVTGRSLLPKNPIICLESR